MDENTGIINPTKANEKIQKAGGHLKLSAVQVDRMMKIGMSAEDLKAIEAELPPLFAKRDAAVHGSKEKDEAVDAILRVILSRG